jgi:hypothetical protein
MTLYLTAFSAHPFLSVPVANYESSASHGDFSRAPPPGPYSNLGIFPDRYTGPGPPGVRAVGLLSGRTPGLYGCCKVD